MGMILFSGALFGDYTAFAGPSYLISVLGLAALGVISYRARQRARDTLSKLERAAKSAEREK